MSTLLTLGLANAACAALLAIPAFLVGRYARRPALAHALWLLVLLKLVTPPFVRPDLGWPAEEPAGASRREVAAEPEPDRRDKPGGSASPAGRRDVWVTRMTASSSSVILTEAPVKGQAVFLFAVPPVVKALPPEPAPEPYRGEGLADIAVLAWLTGSILCLARALFYAARFHGLLSHGRAAPAYIQEQAEALAREMGLRRCPRVWLVPGALPPMVWGVGRVRLLFPEGLLTQLSESERASLLSHELAHVLRRDHWVRLLELAALTLFWWLPLAWWARRQLQAREEECCDAWAAGVVAPRVYAVAILQAVDFLAEARPRLPAMASALESKRSLKERLTLILTRPAPRRLGWPGRLVVAAGAAVLPLLPTLPRVEAASPPPVVKRETRSSTTLSFTVDPLPPARARLEALRLPVATTWLHTQKGTALPAVIPLGGKTSPGQRPWEVSNERRPFSWLPFPAGEDRRGLGPMWDLAAAKFARNLAGRDRPAQVWNVVAYTESKVVRGDWKFAGAARPGDKLAVRLWGPPERN